jgi:hypothetical protein
MKAAVGTTPKKHTGSYRPSLFVASSLLLRGIHFGGTRLAELICQAILIRGSLCFPIPTVNLHSEAPSFFPTFPMAFISILSQVLQLIP